MEGDVVTLQDLFVARAPEHGAWNGSGLLGPLQHDGPSARLPVQARRQRRRAAALDVAGCRVKKLLLAALALSALAAPGGRAGAESGAVQIRRVDADRFPLVRVTAVVPAGSRPTLAEGGRRAEFVKARELGAAQATVLAVDNSASMAGRPLREAKRAAAAFLSRQQAAGDAGLVAFGHEALALTPPRAPQSNVARALRALAPDSQKGTALYDAVTLSVGRLKEMTSGSRVLVLLTDGHDLGSQSSLQQAIAAAQRGERRRLRDRRGRTHGREAPDGPRLGNRRQALRRRRRNRPRRRLPRHSGASSTERGSSPISPPPARVTSRH